MVKWQNDKMIKNTKMAKWQIDKMAKLHNNKMAK